MKRHQPNKLPMITARHLKSLGKRAPQAPPISSAFQDYCCQLDVRVQVLHIRAICHRNARAISYCRGQPIVVPYPLEIVP